MIKLNFIHGDLIDDESSSEVYKATGTIIETILRFLYSGRDLSPDTDHFLTSLSHCLNDNLLVNHASLLGYVGRIGRFEDICVLSNWSMEVDAPRLGLKRCYS